MGLKKALLFFVYLLIATNILAQSALAPKYSNEFLNVGVGAPALGLSNCVVAGVNDVTASYWNPAGLTDIHTWIQGALMHSEYFAGIAKYDYLGLAVPIDEKSTFAFSAIRFGVDDIPNTTQLIDNQGNIDYDRITTFTAADYAFLFSYARKLKVPGLSLGGTFKLIYRKVGNFAHSWGFGLDAGLKYQLGKQWKFGLLARDITSTFNAWVFTLDDQTKQVFQATGNALPQNGLELTLPRFILAAQGKFELGKGFNIMSEIDVDLTTDGKRNVLIRAKPISIDPHIGLQVGFKDIVAVRCGFGNFQYIKDFNNAEKLTFQPNIGLGVHFKGIYIDYAFTDIGNQSVALYSHVISLKFDLKKPKHGKKTEDKKSE